MTLVVQRPCSDGSSDPCCQSRPECKFAFVRELRNAKPQGASEPRLILIQRAERTSSKSEGRSNMQDVQGTSAEEPGLGSGNPPGMRKSRGRYRHDTDQAVVHSLESESRTACSSEARNSSRKMRQLSALMNSNSAKSVARRGGLTRFMTAAAAEELASGTKREKRKRV